MIRLLAVMILIVTVGSSGFPQNPNASPDSPNRSETTVRIDKLFEPWNKPDSAGCALGVFKDGKVIFERGYGMADLEHNASITPQTAFDIGSVAKQFTALAILLLVQQGKLSLDDDVHKYVPEVTDYAVKVTLSNLLYHTSGLRNHFLLYQLRGWRWGDLESRADALDAVARQKELNFKPGDEHSYTNTGYFLLGEVIYRVSGMTLRNFVAQNIFKPLGMNDTQIHDDVSLIMKNRAWGYNGGRNNMWTNNITRSEEVGDSNVYATVQDFARWDQNFYDKKVGGEAITQMLKPGTLNNGRILNYAGGLRLGEYKGLRLVSHAGSSSSRAEYLQFPEQHFSVVCFCNSGSIDPSDLARKAADIYLAGLGRPEPREQPPTAEAAAMDVAGVQSFIQEHAISLSADKLSDLAGFYVNTDNGNRRRLLMKDGKLMIERRPGVENQLVPIASNRFVMANVPGKLVISFEERQPQFRVMLVSSIENATPLALVYAGPESASSPPITEYLGAFQSDEADATVAFAVRDGKLILHARRFEEPKPGDDGTGRGWYPLEPICADAFRNEWIGLLRFTRDSKKQINGFFVSNFAGGVRHLQFQKVH
jgi:CubicO group peptidase (beta-lactamase class C family)